MAVLLGADNRRLHGAVLFAGIARLAGGDHVLPGVGRRDPCFLWAGPEHQSSRTITALRDSEARAIGNLDEIIQPHHCGCGQLEMLTAIYVAVGMEDLGLLSEGKYQRPPVRVNGRAMPARLAILCPSWGECSY